MILDTLDHIDKYADQYPGIHTALIAAKEYLTREFPAARVEVDGDRVFLNFVSYETHPAQGALSEAHRRYIDVMVMIEGSETVYVKPTDQLSRITKEYDPAIDILLAETDPDVTAVKLPAGSFLALFPQEAHAPGCHADGGGFVRKVVGKVQILPLQEEKTK